MTEDDGSRSPGSSRIKRIAATTALATGLLLGGYAVASAQTDSPSTTTDPGGAVTQAPGPAPEGGRAEKGNRGPKGFRHRGGFMMGAIHGEFVTRNGTGFRTMAMQLGKVTKVSASSITIKSDDGYAKTYVVDENTLVNAGRDGIGTVKEGDTVHLDAIVQGDKAHAVRVNDITSKDSIRQHWNPDVAPARSGDA